jgi:glycosyltransferase involved in cell wall biosynthesis
MPHILFILDYYLPHRGGVETVFEQVISKLLKKWYKITLLTSHFDIKLPVFEQQWNLSIYRVWSGRFWFLFAAIFKWISVLRKSPDIKNIHASTYGSAIQASILWKLFHKRVILTVHEVFGKLWYVYKWFWKGFLYLSFERLLFCFAYDKYHCVSRYTMNSLRLLYGVSDHKLHLIYNW